MYSIKRLLTILSALGLLGAAAPPDGALTGGSGTIYLGSYARKIAVIDEATEKLTAEIPLTTGLAWAMRLSRDRSRFFVQNADQERFEVIDVASRKTLDTFTLSEGNKHIRAIAFDVDAENRQMVLVARPFTKLIDRFEIGPPLFIQYDLKEHKVIRTVPWTTDPEPQYYYLLLRFSPDGKLLYVFSNEIVIYDTATMTQVGSWDLSLPNEPGLGGFDLSSLDETNDEPGFFTALFNMTDPVAKRRLLVIGRVDLGQKRIDSFPIGPAPDHGDISFALAPDRKRGYVLLEEIRHHELWTIDMAGRRLERQVPFEGRPRMAIRCSSNSKLIYLYEAGNTIDLYDAATLKYSRTVTLESDMMYGTFHVVPGRAR